jgi:hypothetical protein
MSKMLKNIFKYVKCMFPEKDDTYPTAVIACTNQTNVFDNFTFNNTPYLCFTRTFLKGRIVDISEMNIITCIVKIVDDFYVKLIFKLAEVEIPVPYINGESSKELIYMYRKKLFELVTYNSIEVKDTISRKDMRKILNSRVYLINIYCGEFDFYGRLSAWIYPHNKGNFFDKSLSFNRVLMSEN